MTVFGLWVVGAGVYPLVSRGVVEAFGFAVGVRPIGSGGLRGDPGLGQCGASVAGAVGRAVAFRTWPMVVSASASKAWARLQDVTAVCLRSSVGIWV